MRAEVDEVEPGPTTGPAPRPTGLLACAGVGVLAAVLGLLPWLLGGLHLTPRDLFGPDPLPTGDPLVLLPLDVDAATAVTALFVVGAGAGGLVLRALRRRPRRGAVAAVALGVLVVQVVAALQALDAVSSGLPERRASALYLGALAAVVALAALVGLVVLLLVAARPRGPALLGLAVAGVLAGGWAAALVALLGTQPGEVGASLVGPAARWLPPLLVGAAIAWARPTAPGRVVAACAALLVLWTGPAVITAVTSVVGYRSSYAYPAEMAAYGVQVLRAALLEPAVAGPPIALALVVAVVGTVLLHRRDRRARPPRVGERGRRRLDAGAR